MSLKDKYFINKKDAQLAYNFQRLFTRTFILVVLFFIALFFINYNQKREISSYQLVVHTRDVILQSERTMSLVKDYETGARGFTLTNKDEFLESTAYSKDHLDKEVKNLQDLTKDNPAQVNTVDSFALLIQKKVAISDSNIRLRREQGLDSALAFVAKGYGKRCMDTIRYLESAIQKRENSLLVERKAANEKLVVFNRVIFGLTLLVFLIILVFLFWQTWYNVTEYNNRQKEVYALLRQLSHSLGSAQKLAHIGSWERNIEQDDEKWSDEIFRIFGYDPNTTQPGYQLFLNAIHPLDRLMVEQKINEAEQNRMSYQLEYKIIRPSGEIRHVRGLTEIYLGNDGKLVKLAGTIQDITEQVLKEKEKDHLAKMLQYTNEAARIGWWEMDVLSKQVKWSKMVKEIYEVPDDFVPLPGINSRFIKDEASVEVIQEAVTDALLHGKSYSVELNILTAKNNSIRVRAIGHPEFEDGVCVRLLGVLQDITSHQKQ